MKILASDYDNTLFVSDENIFKNNIKSIKKFTSKGNIFCIITGRNYSNIKVELDKYDIPYNYLICNDGAKIFNCKDECLKTEKLSKETIIKCQKILNEENYANYLEDGYNKITNMDDCIKVVGIYTDKEQAENTITRLKKEVDAYIYLSTEHINIIESHVNKCYGLDSLLKIRNLSSDNLYVIGDEKNDLEMLSKFKGAIMKNHNKELDKLKLKEYETLYEYIEELSKI